MSQPLKPRPTPLLMPKQRSATRACQTSFNAQRFSAALESKVKQSAKELRWDGGTLLKALEYVKALVDGTALPPISLGLQVVNVVIARFMEVDADMKPPEMVLSGQHTRWYAKEKRLLANKKQ